MNYQLLVITPYGNYKVIDVLFSTIQEAQTYRHMLISKERYEQVFIIIELKQNNYYEKA